MRQTTLKLLVKLLTALAVIVFAVLLVLLTFQYVSLNNLERTEQVLATELNTLVETRENYEAEYEYIENHYNDYIEDYVREVLGWGRENEIQFQSEEKGIRSRLSSNINFCHYTTFLVKVAPF